MKAYQTEELTQYLLVVKKRPIVVIPTVEDSEIYDLVERVFKKAKQDEKLRKKYNLNLCSKETSDHDLSAWAEMYYR